MAANTSSPLRGGSALVPIRTLRLGTNRARSDAPYRAPQKLTKREQGTVVLSFLCDLLFKIRFQFSAFQFSAFLKFEQIRAIRVKAVSFPLFRFPLFP